MWKQRYRASMLLFVSIFMFTSACANFEGQAVRNPNQPNLNMQQQSTPAPQTLNNGSDAAVIQIKSHEGQPYVSLDELVNVLQFTYEFDEETQTYNIGDIDVVYEVKVNSREAEKEEEDVQLSNEPIHLNGEILVPTEVINRLFEEDMDYEINEQQLVIYPNEIGVSRDEIYSTEDHEVNDDLDFGDDPGDPAAKDEVIDEEVLDIEGISPEDNEAWNPFEDESMTVQARKQVNANTLIATGKKYLGVKYKFGAGKYARTKRFDCSSFVQQLYNTYGVRLPRTARKQAKHGISVSKSNLRKGDLLYFYVPGRFRTNKTVGHVGVYIGNKKMLHSSPAPKNGVQISSINSSYWKRTYLGAKRVIR